MNPDYLDTKNFKDNFEKLVKFLEGKRVVLFGGEDLEFIKSKCDLSRLNILGIFDPHFEEKHFNRYYQGFKILSENLVMALNPDYMLDLSLGLNRFKKLFERCIDFEFLSILSDVSKPQLQYIEVHITDHCNLNCKSCAAFSPFAPENFTDIEQFKKDMKELSEKIDIENIRLLGGEPLLHKQINEFIKITRKCFPASYISIVTNGILLPSMKEDFWQCCVENDIKFDLSLYPKTKTDKYLNLIKKYNTEGMNKQRDYFMNISLKSAPINDDIDYTYNNCNVTLCKNLRNGKLYSCETDCYIDYFNKYFNMNLPQSEGIDIYKNNGETIVKKINQGVELCKHCDISNRVKSPWGISKKDISEWLVD